MYSQRYGFTSEQTPMESSTQGQPKRVQFKDQSVEAILHACFKHQIQIKMIHFQTESYAIHKNVDAYLLKFNVNFDALFEVLQGVLGQRVTSNRIALDIKMFEDVPTSISAELDAFASKVLTNMVTPLSNNTELLAIRDTMVSDIRQLKYLLTFK